MWPSYLPCVTIQRNCIAKFLAEFCNNYILSKAFLKSHGHMIVKNDGQILVTVCNKEVLKTFPINYQYISCVEGCFSCYLLVFRCLILISECDILLLFFSGYVSFLIATSIIIFW